MTQLTFEYEQHQLSAITTQILDKSLKLGATSAQIEVNEIISTGVDILSGNVENFETSYSSSLTLCVYVGHNRGSISISQINPHNIDEIIQQGLSIAKHTEADQYNGIAEKDFLCTSMPPELELNLYNPYFVSNQELINRAKNIENISLAQSDKIKASDGASISYGQYNFAIANTNGLNLGYKTTRYSSSISLIGENTDGMQTDGWYDNSRDYHELIDDSNLAQTAVYRTLRRLNKGQLNKSGQYSVIFESSIAKSLIGSYIGAISGNNLFRRLSFLNDSMHQQIFPNWVNIIENPFINKGNSSCYFDGEGVNVTRRNLVQDGKVNGYILNCYSARKLGMITTGNAGGNHNLLVNSNFSGDIAQLANKLHQGMIIIETIGHGINMVTGDYSVGASGLWVDNGEIQFFVDNLTISGNLKQMYQNIRYISDDYNPHSSIHCGSMLIDGINVAT